MRTLRPQSPVTLRGCLSTKKSHQWLVLAGHEMGQSGPQTTRLAMLKQLLEYAKDPANGIWIAPIGTVAKYVEEQRK